jgi:type IV secretory pathway VirB10-like protein
VGDERVQGTKRWPIIAVIGLLFVLIAGGLGACSYSLAHNINRAVAQPAATPAVPEAALTSSPQVDESPETPFPMRPVKTVASLFAPATARPSACCVTASSQVTQTASPQNPPQTAPPQRVASAGTPMPAPVLEHKLENMDFTGRDGAQNTQAAQDVRAAPTIAPNYAMAPRSKPQDRYVLPSQFEISDTDFFRCKLLTRIDSEHPGVITCVVTRPVLDSATHSVELIPAGSTVHGDDQHASVRQGQGRLAIDWYEIVLPNLVMLPIGRQQSSDMMGAAGIPGHVDSHQGQNLGKFIIYTLVSGLGNAIGRVSYLGGTSLGTEFAQNSQEIKPTITVEPNTDMDVYLSEPLRDLRPWSEIRGWAR